MSLAALMLVAGCVTSSSESTSAFLRLAEDRLYYEVSGDGFPVVLVSGGSGMDRMQWKDVAPALSEEFQVVLLEPRGIGKSDNPSARYSDAADIAALLDHLGLERPVLVGLSSAGNTVLEFAALYPERTVGIVAAAPFIPGFEFSVSMQARVDKFSEAARKGREAFLKAMFTDPYFIPAPLNPEVRAMARKNMGQNFDKWSDVEPSLPVPLHPPLIERLANIQAPVLLLAGKLDHPDVLRRNRYLMDQIPHAREMLIDEAGHNTALENPGAFLAAVTPFLRNFDR